MDHLLYHVILLAQRSRLDSLSSGFRGRRARFEAEDVLIGVLILAAIGVVVGLLSYLLRLQERRRSYHSPTRLFLSLCKAHRLGWSQRWLLWRVARAQRLRDPARLFLEPQRFEPPDLGRSPQTRRVKLAQIRDRLLGDLEAGQENQDSPDRQAPEHALPAAGIPPTTPAWDATSPTAVPTPNSDATAGGPRS